MRGERCVYIYVDSDGIDGLYAQTTDRVELELTRSRSEENHGDVGIKAGFGCLFTALLGLKDAGAETNLGTTRRQIEEAKSRLSLAHKLDQLSEYLVRTTDCFENLEAAAESVSKPGQHVFVCVETKFDAPDFFPGAGGASVVNSSRAMVFRIDNRYDASDSYFKRCPFSVAMTASLEKFTRLRSGMGATSREAVRFRGFEGKNVPMMLGQGQNTSIGVTTPSGASFDADTAGGESIDGPYPIDENNGWVNFTNTDSSSETYTITQSLSTRSLALSSSQADSFMAPGATLKPANVLATNCYSETSSGAKTMRFASNGGTDGVGIVGFK
jgi:hypothetical protein